MKKLKTMIKEAGEGEVKWKNSQGGFRGKFVDSNGTKFGVDIAPTPMDYTSKADNKLLDTLWKDETSASDFDDYGFACVCFDAETMGQGNLDSSTLPKVSEMFVKILVDKFSSNRIQFVYFQSKRPLSKKNSRNYSS